MPAVATEVEIRSGIADKLGYACRLLRKAVAQGARVVVTGDTATLRELDRLLWTFEPHAFVAHARLEPGRAPAERLTARTPVWLVEPGAEMAQRGTVLHLGREALARAAGFARVIDLVGVDDDDRRAGRRRWRAYEAAGLSIAHRPAQSGEGSA